MSQTRLRGLLKLLLLKKNIFSAFLYVGLLISQTALAQSKTPCVLTNASNDDDIKFLVYNANNNCAFRKDETLSLEWGPSKFSNLESIIQNLFTIYNEDPTPSKIASFKKIRVAPSAAIKQADSNLLYLLNYVALVKSMLVSGSLQNKAYIDEVTRGLNIKFDPDFLLLNIKSATINSAEETAGLDRIYTLKVTANKTYSVLAGLRNIIPQGQLIGTTSLFILNVKPVKMGSEVSEAMILVGKDSEKTDTLKASKPNKKIKLEGYFDIFDDLIYENVDLKKAEYSKIIKNFQISGNYLTYKGVKVLCDGGYVKTSIANGQVM